LITVANIPYNRLARDPFAPATPLKIFPPPITMAISTPLSWICFYFVSIFGKSFGSIPYCKSPIKASPLNFRRILLFHVCVALIRANIIFFFSKILLHKFYKLSFERFFAAS
jgi:hypothetical protein